LSPGIRYGAFFFRRLILSLFSNDLISLGLFPFFRPMETHLERIFLLSRSAPLERIVFLRVFAPSPTLSLPSLCRRFGDHSPSPCHERRIPTSVKLAFFNSSQPGFSPPGLNTFFPRSVFPMESPVPLHELPFCVGVLLKASPSATVFSP